MCGFTSLSVGGGWKVYSAVGKLPTAMWCVCVGGPVGGCEGEDRRDRERERIGVIIRNPRSHQTLFVLPTASHLQSYMYSL